MDRLFSVEDAESGATADVLLQCAPDTDIGVVVAQLQPLLVSTAGRLVRDGRPVATAAEIVDGDILRLTHDLAVGSAEPVSPRSARTVPTASRAVPSYDARTVAYPTPPQPATRPRLPVISALAPAAVGVVLAIVLGHGELLAFAVFSPLVVVAQMLGDWWQARRATRAAAVAFEAAWRLAEASMAAAVTEEQQWRRAAWPSPKALAESVATSSDIVWRRDPQPLRLRVGIGSVPALTTADNAPPRVEDVPVPVDLGPGDVALLIGDDGTCRDLARALLVQAAVLHSPLHLQLAVVAPGRSRDWAWARWLPHARVSGAADVAVGGSGDVDAVVARATASTGVRLVVVDGAPAGAIEQLRRSGAAVVAVDAASSVDAVTVIDGAPGRACVRTPGASTVPVTPDGIDPNDAERLARSLARLQPLGEGAATLARQVHWCDLHDIDLQHAAAASAALARRWRRGPTLRVTLGAGADGPVAIDLERDGPHALVAGTTGSGKSELLQTLVAGLTAANSPEDLHLVLVDFKGGTAFGACRDMPHIIDLLTDLDPASSTRVLTALRAELQRREHLLATVSASALGEWPRDAVGRPPRLVVVVDEFATLARDLPEFLDGLVDIAQRGRALGVHLVLATQRPEGVVSADIRANTRLRICLAVAGDAESRAVIDSALAASIPPSVPGRAYVRVGSEPPRLVQTATVVAPYATSASVTLLPATAWSRPPRPCPSPDASQLLLLTRAVQAAATAEGAATQCAPWLPPLPDRVGLADVVDDNDVAVGIVDDAPALSQPPLTLALDVAEPLLLVGAPRSGRTTSVLAMATALAARLGPDELHIWGIDGADGLHDLTTLPHIGSVAPVHDLPTVERLLAHLEAEVHRRLRGAAGRTPQLLLVVDPWESLVAADADGGCAEAIARLAATGAPAGLRVLVTADRSGLVSRLPATITLRFCLALADSGDYALAGVPPRQVPSVMPPGRAVRVSDGLPVQMAVVDAATAATARRHAQPAHRPQPFLPLPRHVRLDELQAVSSHQPHDRLLVGVDVTSEPVGLPAAASVLVVAGPAGSGRSTTLHTLAAQLTQQGCVIVTADPRLEVRIPHATVVAPSAVDPVGSVKAALEDGVALLVDDAELVADPALVDLLDDVVRHACADGRFVAVATTADAAAAAFRGPIATARRCRTVLWLQPDARIAREVIGGTAAFRRRAGEPPGRGVLAVRGEVTPVQVADAR